jgi:hypothetical protein
VAISAIATFLTSAYLRTRNNRQTDAQQNQQKQVVVSSYSAPGSALVDVTSSTISRLEALFNVPADMLNLIVKHMVAEMKKGLASDNHCK